MTDGLQRLLVFTVKGLRYALELQDIAEVVECPEIYPAPWATGPIKGAMNFHGSLVAVLDLAEFMKAGSANPSGNVLVLDKRAASLGLRVDGIVTIVPAEGILEEDESSEPMVDNVLIMADGEVRMLALDKLLDTIEATLRR